MGLGVDVGIDADAHRRAPCPRPLATSLSTSSSASLSTLKQPMPTSSARRISARVLPTPEKMMSPALAARGQHALEFAARHDVESAAGLREDLQHAQRRVGFHRIADAGLAAGEAALVSGQRCQHRRLGIDEQRRAVLARQGVPAGRLRRTARRRGRRNADGRAAGMVAFMGSRVGEAVPVAGGAEAGRGGCKGLRQGGARRGRFARGKVTAGPSGHSRPARRPRLRQGQAAAHGR